MMSTVFQRYSRSALVTMLSTGILFCGVPPLFALDIFGSGKSEEQTQPAQPGRSGALQSLVDTAKHASPAVVNVSTTQKVERRRPPRLNPMPGPNPFGGEDPFEEFFRRFFPDRPPPGQARSLGSGFIISEDG